MKKVLAIVLVTFLIAGCSQPVRQETSSEARLGAAFESCDELNLEYRGGVSRSGAKNTGSLPLVEWIEDQTLYEANVNLDEDKDGIACEITTFVEDANEAGGQTSDQDIESDLEVSRNGYESVCDFGEHDFAPEEFEIWSKKTGFCTGPTGWFEAIKDSPLPNTWDPSGQESSIELCKIQNSPELQNRAFPVGSQILQYQNMFPRPGARLLIVGVAGTDSLPSNQRPESDYAYLGKFIAQWVNGMDDFSDDFEVRFNDEYIKLDIELESFGVAHYSDANSKNFGKYLEGYVRPHLADIDGVLVVTTPGTKRGVLEQGALGGYVVNGKFVPVMSVPPATFSTRFVRDFPMILPMEIIHEWGHAGSGLDDPNGSNYFQNEKEGDPDDLGMGGWGLQSTSKTDRTAWNRWITGFLRDEQVICADTSGTHALKATSVMTQEKKILVVPLDNEHVLVAESIRATGLNYKLGFESEGLLVYEVNTADVRQHYGAKLILPEGRVAERRIPLIVPDAPLKPGESVTHKGFKITVLDAIGQGNFVELTAPPN